MHLKPRPWLLGSFLLLLLVAGNLHAQDMPRTVVGSSGDYYDNLLFGTLHFTVGEVAVARYQNGLELGEGFHRAYYDLIVDTREITPSDWNVDIYPNPTTVSVRVRLPKPGTTSAELYDATGRLLLREPVLEIDREIDLSAYPAGTYLLRLRDQQGNEGTFKVLKMKY